MKPHRFISYKKLVKQCVNKEKRGMQGRVKRQEIGRLVRDLVYDQGHVIKTFN